MESLLLPEVEIVESSPTFVVGVGGVIATYLQGLVGQMLELNWRTGLINPSLAIGTGADVEHIAYTLYLYVWMIVPTVGRRELRTTHAGSYHGEHVTAIVAGESTNLKDGLCLGFRIVQYQDILP